MVEANSFRHDVCLDLIPSPPEIPSPNPVADTSPPTQLTGHAATALSLAAAHRRGTVGDFVTGQPAVQGPNRPLPSVLQYATQHHPLLRVRQYEIEAARAKIVTARLLPNPELTVDTLDSSAEPGPPELNTRLMFTLPIGPKRELRTAAAETGVCEAQLAMSRDTKLILTEAADAAVEVLYLQELYALYGQLSGLANQVAGIQTERFNVAAVPFRNVVLTELAANRLELLRQNTAAELDQAKVRLARAVGATDGTPPAVDGQLAVEPIAFAPVAAMQARVRQVAPELAESRTAIEKSREELSLEQWNAVPDLKIGPALQERYDRRHRRQMGWPGSSRSAVLQQEPGTHRGRRRDPADQLCQAGLDRGDYRQRRHVALPGVARRAGPGRILFRENPAADAKRPRRPCARRLWTERYRPMN